MFFLFIAICHFAAGSQIEYKCSNQDEFYHAVPDSRCTSYYKCNRDKTMMKHECTPGSTFDFYKQQCSRAAGIYKISWVN